MEKISVTIDVSKIDKSKIVDRKYTNKEGIEITEKNYKFDVVAVKEVKVLATGPTWVMKKTHFVVEQQTKEEKDSKVKNNYIGEGIKFESTQANNGNYDNMSQDHSAVDPDTGIDLNVNPEDIPF